MINQLINLFTLICLYKKVSYYSTVRVVAYYSKNIHLTVTKQGACLIGNYVLSYIMEKCYALYMQILLTYIYYHILTICTSFNIYNLLYLNHTFVQAKPIFTSYTNYFITIIINYIYLYYIVYILASIY